MAESLETETLARLYLAQGDPERALRIYERLAAARPGSSSLAEGLARCRAEIAHEQRAPGQLEGGMDPNQKRLQMLQNMLQRLTGQDPEPQQPMPSAPVNDEMAVPPVSVQASAGSSDPVQHKIDILQAMLARLRPE